MKMKAIDKELESTKVIRYMIRNIQKRIAVDIIHCLKNNWPDEEIDELYEERWRMNAAYKYFSPNKLKWKN